MLFALICAEPGLMGLAQSQPVSQESVRQHVETVTAPCVLITCGDLLIIAQASQGQASS